MATPALTIEVSDRGINRLVIHTERGHESSPLDLLYRALPAIKELDQCVLRKGTMPRRAQKASVN